LEVRGRRREYVRMETRLDRLLNSDRLQSSHRKPQISSTHP
jgi:hypothetical protein